jgi:hypothetical protein
MQCQALKELNAHYNKIIMDGSMAEREIADEEAAKKK